MAGTEWSFTKRLNQWPFFTYSLSGTHGISMAHQWASPVSNAFELSTCLWHQNELRETESSAIALKTYSRVADVLILHRGVQRNVHLTYLLWLALHSLGILSFALVGKWQLGGDAKFNANTLSVVLFNNVNNNYRKILLFCLFVCFVMWSFQFPSSPPDHSQEIFWALEEGKRRTLSAYVLLAPLFSVAMHCAQLVTGQHQDLVERPGAAEFMNCVLILSGPRFWLNPMLAVARAEYTWF